MPTIIACVIVGILLGSAQELTRLAFNYKHQLKELVSYILTIATLYSLATFQWIRIIRSGISLTSCYAVVILGVFLGLKVTALFTKAEPNNLFTFRDTLGIILIFLGSMIVRR